MKALQEEGFRFKQYQRDEQLECLNGCGFDSFDVGLEFSLDDFPNFGDENADDHCGHDDGNDVSHHVNDARVLFSQQLVVLFKQEDQFVQAMLQHLLFHLNFIYFLLIIFLFSVQSYLLKDC